MGLLGDTLDTNRHPAPRRSAREGAAVPAPAPTRREGEACLPSPKCCSRCSPSTLQRTCAERRLRARDPHPDRQSRRRGSGTKAPEACIGRPAQGPAWGPSPWRNPPAALAPAVDGYLLKGPLEKFWPRGRGYGPQWGLNDLLKQLQQSGRTTPSIPQSTAAQTRGLTRPISQTRSVRHA